MFVVQLSFATENYEIQILLFLFKCHEKGNLNAIQRKSLKKEWIWHCFSREISAEKPPLFKKTESCFFLTRQRFLTTKMAKKTEPPQKVKLKQQRGNEENSSSEVSKLKAKKQLADQTYKRS